MGERIKENIPRIVYAILLIGSAIFVSFEGGVIPYALFFLVLLYLPVSFVYLLICKMGLTSHQEVDSPGLAKQQKERYSLVLENLLPIPIGALRLVVPADVFAFEDDFAKAEYSLAPRQRLLIETRIICKYAGCYGVGVYRLCLSDPFCIFRISYDIPQGPVQIYVKPDITDVAYESLGSLLSDMDPRARRFTQERTDITTGNDLRGYMDGDPINRIHWKTFAKTGDLFVRLPENADLQMPVIVLESGDFFVKEEYMKRRDRFIEYAVSAADFFVRQKKPVKIICYYFEIKEYVIDGYESFERFYIDITRHLSSRSVEKENGRMYEMAGGKGSFVLWLTEGDRCEFYQRAVN